MDVGMSRILKKPTMKIVLLACVLALLMGCRSSSEETGEKTGAQAYSDTVSHADPYLKYTYAQRRGQALYDHYCVLCHGPEGRGDGLNADALDSQPRDFTDSTWMAAQQDTVLSEMIHQGGRGGERSILMPAYAWSLTEDEVSFIVAYIRLFSE
jgi:mono/diheme cytochrome c family protein